MFDAELMAAFTLFSFVTAITPGPNNLMVLASGVNFGWRRSLPHITGVIVGFPSVAIIVAIGLGDTLEANPEIHQFIRWPGVLFILYLAWSIATANEPSAAPLRNRPLTFIEAWLFQWINPKAVIVIMTTFAVYTSTEYPVFGQVAFIAFIYALSAGIAVTTWLLLGVNLKKLMRNTRHLRIFNIAMGMLLVIAVLPIVFDS